MAKDFEVILWPMWESLGGDMYADLNDRQHPVNVFYNLEVKRLKDDELAAEYQSARADLWEARATFGPIEEGLDLTAEQVESNRTRKQLYDLLEDQLQTLERFAETVHHTRTDGTEHN